MNQLIKKYLVTPLVICTLSCSAQNSYVKHSLNESETINQSIDLDIKNLHQKNSYLLGQDRQNIIHPIEINGQKVIVTSPTTNLDVKVDVQLHPDLKCYATTNVSGHTIVLLQELLNYGLPSIPHSQTNSEEVKKQLFNYPFQHLDGEGLEDFCDRVGNFKPNYGWTINSEDVSFYSTYLENCKKNGSDCQKLTSEDHLRILNPK